MEKLKATHSFTVFPHDLNYADSLFGGKILLDMDMAGVKVVRRALYGTGADGCVTASIERVDFDKPGFVGDIITMDASIKAFGRSSIQVRIKVRRESLEGDVEQMCAANFTLVAVKDKKPYHHGLSFEKLKNEEKDNK